MNEQVLLTVLVFVASLAAIALFIIKKFSAQNNAPQNVDNVRAAQEDNTAVVPAAQRVRGLGRLRQRPAQQREEAGVIDAQESGASDDESGEKSLKKIGKKKAEKLAMKEKAKEDREQMLVLRAEKEAQEQARMQAEKEARAAETAAELLEKQKVEKEEQERKRKEQDEYERIKNAFVVEAGGSQEDTIAAESQSLLTEFVNFIKTKKVVLLEDIAAQFNLKTKDVINRIRNLEDMELLTGFMDDRGKYVYVSSEELAAVSKWIKQRGRISISDLAENSSTLIRLNE